jgi:dCTP deaminase
MILSDRTIRDLCKHEELISPFKPENVQPASYDLTLGIPVETFRGLSFPRDLVQGKPLRGKLEKIGLDGYRIEPGEFLLGTTVEQVCIPENIAARFEGKSTLGRYGLSTHITAGFIDPGFCGKITLEIKNNNTVPLIIHPRMKIGQICFITMDDYAQVAYGSPELGSHYQGQQTVTGARV